jgi:bifunctional enzyme CysN/CysC
LHGCNVVQKSQNMPWYNGKSLLEFLESVHVASDRNFNDFRFPVQYVIRPNRNFRGFAGKVASGIVSQGDKVMALPSRKISRVKEIVTYNGMLDKAFPPQSVTITLEDEIDISRGEMLVHPDNMPKIGRQFEAMLVWMDEEPMDLQKQYYLKHNSNGNKARIDMVRYRTDVNSLDNHQVETLSLNEIGRVVITTVKPLLYDLYLKNRQTGSFVLIDPLTHNTAAVGMIIERLNLEEMPSRIDDMDKARIERGVGLITKQEYENFYKQKGETIWITGLHGSGKNELAFLLEKQLFNLGATVVLLEGSAVRSGLSRELDFTAADRAEHLRRVAHVCRLLNDQGIITICSFISPGEDIRKQVAGIIGPERFHLIFMDASLDYCKQNKPDLYEKASRGETSKVPGLDATYEKPVNPVLIFKPEQNGQNPQRIIEYLRGKGVFSL